MMDLLYIAGTLLFFAAMLGYVRACSAVGDRSDATPAEERVS